MSWAELDPLEGPATVAAAGREGMVLLDAGDQALMAAHLKRLDADDRINRFCCVTTDDIIEQYVSGIRYDSDIVLGSLEAGRLVGLVHAAVFDTPEGRVCEIGISVDADRRKAGIGKRMLAASMAVAASRGIRRADVQYMTANRSMAALARSAGGRLQADGSESSAAFLTAPG
ncbi:MAG TPA: GNAT family N-acetyltransferase [Albitalea sp.]|nr:GNAT family N-acetyltransferase [Albitalea sp.]